MNATTTPADPPAAVREGRAAALLRSLRSRPGLLLLLFLAALLPRAWIAWTSQCISSDGPVYAEVAARYFAGDWQGGLGHLYQPLYPVAMAGAYAVVGDWERAGQLVSVLASSLAILPLWFLTRRLFGERAALAAALIYALSPYPVRLSADVLTTGLYLALTLLALWAAVAGFGTWRPGWCLLAGLAAGLSYLVRLDGIVLGALLAGWSVVWRPREWRAEPRRRALAVAALGLALAATAGPYLIYLRLDTGTWMVSRKTPVAYLQTSLSIPDFVAVTKPLDPVPEQNDPTHPSAPEQAPASGGFAYKWFSALRRVLHESAETCPWQALPLLAAGLWAAFARGPRRLETLFVLSIPLAFEAALWVFSASHQRESKRYTTPILVWLLPWFGLGTAWLGDQAARRCGSDARRAFAVVLAIALLSLAPKTCQPIGGGRSGEKNAGVWIRDHATTRPPVIVTNVPRSGFYAGGTMVALGKTNQFTREQFRDLIRQAGAHYVVADRWMEVVCGGFFDWTRDQASGLRLVHSSDTVLGNDEGFDQVRVYEVVPQK